MAFFSYVAGFIELYLERSTGQQVPMIPIIYTAVKLLIRNQWIKELEKYNTATQFARSDLKDK